MERNRGMSREGFYWKALSSSYTLNAGRGRSEAELLRSEIELLRKSKAFVARKWRGREKVLRVVFRRRV